MIFGQIEQEQVLHAIEGEAFPEFSGKADIQTFGVAH
jgi:hypothetical protein